MGTMNDKFYSFYVKSLQGKILTMSDFKGKTLLIVNTASRCGLTPQYKGLEELYQKYKQDGLVILGFPCNQFGNQEPGTSKDIQEGCLVNYGVSFPMFEKVDVNGKNAHPLFVYLKAELPGLIGQNVKWNFTKFLVDANGKPTKRFSPITSPKAIDRYLRKFFSE